MNNKQLEFFGRITEKKLTKIYNKTSPYYNKEFWRLQVALENKPEVKEILVIYDYLENTNIFSKLEQWEDYNQNYLFYCNRKPGAGRIYRLVNWKEINNNHA